MLGANRYGKSQVRVVKVTRTAGTSLKGIYPGDTVIVQGSKHSDGSITASQIRATAKGASGGGAALFGGAPPGGAPPGAGG